MSKLRQPTLFDFYNADDFPLSSDVLHAVESLASNSSADDRGAVYTRTEVVHFILNLVGYTQDQPLYKQRILEPSFGGGDFLLPIIRRLLASWKAHHAGSASLADDLGDSIAAVELHRETFLRTRESVIEQLQAEGVEPETASALADRWLLQGDFLLQSFPGQFDFVVGNPPYVRQELIPAPLLSEYRQRYQTLYDRGDLYVPFIEYSLRLLKKGGTCGLICADRWMKNRYGGPLRQFISDGYHLKAYVDLTDSCAFHTEVSAYPAITLISRERPGATRIAHRPKIEEAALGALASKLLSKRPDQTDSTVTEMAQVARGSDPWLLNSPDQMNLIRRIESRYPLIEQAGCRVGIGVATGADKVFIHDFESLDVEPDRKLPLVTTTDIQSGEILWGGQGVINPFTPDGGLVDLDRFPRLARYLEERREIIGKRHCARKDPSKWYRTIDRIRPELARTPKLLIPDIKGEAHVVYESGRFYPHHNLYYILSDSWDLHALQAVLLSRLSRLFIATYSTPMRGGYLRFQAQYLRRIRIPLWQDVNEALRTELKAAAQSRDIEACNRAVVCLYQLNKSERTALGCNGA